jgi:hypothetical protein
MPVNTLSAAVHITPSELNCRYSRPGLFTFCPAVIKTFIEHSKRKAKKCHQRQLEELSTDDICYDEYVDQIMLARQLESGMLTPSPVEPFISSSHSYF